MPRLVPGWVSLSYWDQSSLNQLGLIATDAAVRAVGRKAENRLLPPRALDRQTTRRARCLQRAEGLDGSHGEVAKGILTELGLHGGQEHSWRNAVDVSAPCLVRRRILICIFS